MVCPTLGDSACFGLFAEKKKKVLVEELITLLRSFYDQNESKLLHNRSKSLIDGVLRNSSSFVFSFLCSDPKKREQYLHLVHHTERKIKRLLSQFKEEKIILDQSSFHRLEESRNNLMTHLGLYIELFIESRAGRDLASTLEEIIDDLGKFLDPKVGKGRGVAWR